MSLPDVAPPPLPAVSSVPIEPARAPTASRPPRNWYFLGTALFGLMVFLIQQIAMVATFIAWLVGNDIVLPVPREELRRLLMNGGQLGLAVIVSVPFVLGALWIPIRIARQPFSEYLGLRRPARAELIRGLAMVIALWLAWFLIRLGFGQAKPEFVMETYRSARDSGALIVLVIGICIAAPIAEEAFIRGFLFRGWSQSFLRPAGAIALSSAVWAAMHVQYNLFYIVQIFTVGLLLGHVRHRSGSIWPTMAMHAAWNVVSLAEAAVIGVYA